MQVLHLREVRSRVLLPGQRSGQGQEAAVRAGVQAARRQRVRKFIYIKFHYCVAKKYFREKAIYFDRFDTVKVATCMFPRQVVVGH